MTSLTDYVTMQSTIRLKNCHLLPLAEIKNPVDVKTRTILTEYNIDPVPLFSDLLFQVKYSWTSHQLHFKVK